ncbi:2-hydroxyacid dehydrogenase [Desulfovibrio legallii]|nr:D-glycerate dehydrogenase [Desulfovibrio legallii]
MSQPNIYVVRAIVPESVALLQTRCTVEIGPLGGLDHAALCRAVKGRDGIIAPVLPLDAEVVAALAPTCKIIACYGVGFDHVDVAAATRHGIWVTHNPGLVTDDTADLAMALMLGVARRLHECDAFVRSGQQPWGLLLKIGHRVSGKTLGLVGSGRIAQAVARRAAGFGMRLLYTAHRPKPDFEAQTGAQFLEKDDLLAAADFISLHVPLTAETRHYIGKRELELMPRHAILINTARGPVVDEDALVAALKEGGIAGAGLDVFECEPQIHPGLRDFPNVLLTPHKGATTMDGFISMGNSCAEKIFAALEGRVPPDCLNPEARQG